MHRTINISLPSNDSQDLCEQLATLKTVVGVSLFKGVSIKPPGDLITVDVLNKGADDVLKFVRDASEQYELSITTHEVASFIDSKKNDVVNNYVDEAIWEEMETGLRHQGCVTTNFIILMALGGAICAVGLISEPAPQAYAFAAAGIIAPGFEPLAKIPLGLVLKRWQVAGRRLTASIAGYVVLIASAAHVTFVLLKTGMIQIEELLNNPEIKHIAHPTLQEFIVSGAGAIAGMVIISAYRRSVIV